MTEYDEDEWLTRYILKFYSHLMTAAEVSAMRVLRMRAKAEPCEEEAMERMDELKISEALGDPKVRRLLRNGSVAFRRAVRDRLLSKHPWRIKLNRCPSCDRIPRTPKAKQCPWCLKQWR